MSSANLEQRVAQLEQQMALLLPCRNGTAAKPGPDDWRSTVGMFDGDAVFKEMLDEAQRLREDDRRQARDAAEQSSP